MSQAAKRPSTLTAARLKELLEYDPKTGVFRWKARPVRSGTERTDRSWNGRYAGKEAGDVFGQPIKRRRIRLDSRNGYLSHRLAWLWMTGEWPHAEIDHKDMNPLNNKWDNLREATHSQNSMNRRNKGQYEKGVYRHRQSGLYQARIHINCKCLSLGYFKTSEEAHVAYCRAAIELHGQYARLK